MKILLIIIVVLIFGCNNLDQNLLSETSQIKGRFLFIDKFIKICLKANKNQDLHIQKMDIDTVNGQIVSHSLTFLNYFIPQANNEKKIKQEKTYSKFVSGENYKVILVDSFLICMTEGNLYYIYWENNDFNTESTTSILEVINSHTKVVITNLDTNIISNVYNYNGTFNTFKINSFLLSRKKDFDSIILNADKKIILSNGNEIEEEIKSDFEPK